MSSVQAAPSRSSGSGSGGGCTGFLFGNIDKRGRLDEDYMDDDAKDALDNVAPTVTDRDRDLKEITNALPTRATDDGADDEDYDDEDGNQSIVNANDERVDYYDETEYLDDGLDEDADRHRMASVALAAAKQPGASAGAPVSAQPAQDDDDENYDDDDDAPAADEKTAQRSVTLPSASASAPGTAMPPTPTLVLPPEHPSSGAHVIVSTPVPSPEAAQVASPAANVDIAAAPIDASAKLQHPEDEGDYDADAPAPARHVVEEDDAFALQKRLMEEARRAHAAPKQSEVEDEDHDDDAPPPKFSEVFSEPVPPLRMIPRRRIFGVRKRENTTQSSLRTAPDDNLRLETPPPAPAFDPVQHFLDMDRRRVEEAASANRPNGTVSEEVHQDAMEIDSTQKDGRSVYSDDEEAAAPLDESCSPLVHTSEYSTEHLLVQQVAWEEDIRWDVDDAAGDDADEEQDDEDDDDDDDDDEDDDMWEDGKAASGTFSNRSDSAVASPANTATPLSTPAPTANAQSGSTQKNGNIPEAAASLSKSAPSDSDSDDDMEWEDGNTAAEAAKTAPVSSAITATASQSASKPSPLVSRPIPLSKPVTPNKSVPLSKPSSANNHKSSPVSKAVPLSKPIPLSKPLLSSKPPPNSNAAPTSSKPPSGPPSLKSASGRTSQTGVANDASKKDDDLKQTKNVRFAKEDSTGKSTDKDGKDSEDKKKEDKPKPKRIPTVERQTSSFIQSVLTPNRDLEEGKWVEDILWDSGCESDTNSMEKRPSVTVEAAISKTANRFSRLILDVNDPNMVFEHLSDDSQDGKMNTTMQSSDSSLRQGEGSPSAKVRPGKTSSPRMASASRDPFNISNDLYYSTGGATNQLKFDRRLLLRGIHNAPPAIKCQTTKCNPSEDALMSFHRPKLELKSLPKENTDLQPFRRKRPKGGSAQIAGQIPKKKGELYCSAKDAYRVTLFEYALEKQPSILPIPGMASKIYTFARKRSEEAVEQARKDAAGTPDADTWFLSPQDEPPLYAGDIEVDGKPISVLESHIFGAPCVKTTVPTTDFLVLRRGGKMHVREIDSVVALGVTEPKVEVMAPNTDRFKKYAKDRVLLYILREFTRQRKKSEKDKDKDKASTENSVPSIDKDQILSEFFRRRTFPETSLLKMLREVARYHNGKYTLLAEPSKGFAGREAELLRTITAEETAAFEAMEAGWETLIQYGIRIFTLPTTQGNIMGAAEKTGLQAGPAVGAFIKNQLLQSPWYRSQMIISAQRAQQKEMTQALYLAKIVSDLREGGSVMESRLLSLTSGDMQNVLNNQYRVVQRKIPTDIEERRKVVREHSLKKTKTSEPIDFAEVIENVISKIRTVKEDVTLNSQAIPTLAFVARTTIPLSIQRKALEENNVSELPLELNRTFAAEVQAAAQIDVTGDDAFGKNRIVMNSKSGKTSNSNRVSGNKPPLKSKKPPASKPAKSKQEADDEAQLNKLSSVIARADSKASANRNASRGSGASVSKTASKQNNTSPGQDPKKKTKKIPTKLKHSKKVVDPDGTVRTVVRMVTDPAEIKELMARREEHKKNQAERSSSAGASNDGKANDPLKVAINLRQLSQGGKAGVKKTQGSGPPEKKKSGAKKASASSDALGKDASGSGSVRKVGDKNQIGKIRINTKKIREEKEEAALKRKRSQYGEDLDYPARKLPKTGVTSRRKRNGTVQLNNILEQIEKKVRATEGYVAQSFPMKIARVKSGVKPPPGVSLSNLAAPANTGLDFTVAVDTKKVPQYKEIVKKQMYLDHIKHKCKKQSYHSSKDFLADIELLVNNARAFNSSEDVQWVVQHAELLQEVAIELVQEKKDEIQAAEEMVQVEKSDVKTESKTSSKKKKKKKSADASKTKEDGATENGSQKKSKSSVSPKSDEAPGLDTAPKSSPGPQPSPGPESVPASSPGMYSAGVTTDIFGMDGPVLEPTAMDGGPLDAYQTPDGEHGGLDLDNELPEMG